MPPKTSTRQRSRASSSGYFHFKVSHHGHGGRIEGNSCRASDVFLNKRANTHRNARKQKGLLGKWTVSYQTTFRVYKKAKDTPFSIPLNDGGSSKYSAACRWRRCCRISSWVQRFFREPKREVLDAFLCIAAGPLLICERDSRASVLAGGVSSAVSSWPSSSHS